MLWFSYFHNGKHLIKGKVEKGILSHIFRDFGERVATAKHSKGKQAARSEEMKYAVCCALSCEKETS